MKQKLVLITNGSGGSGKDEIAKYMQASGKKVYKYSAVTKIKDICAMMGCDPHSKTERNRAFMHDIKMLTVGYNDLPFQDMKDIYDAFMAEKLPPSANDKYCDFRSDFPVAEILILDIREPSEITKAVSGFDAATILVKRPSVKQITSNYADASVSDYAYDVILINNGTLEDLKGTTNKMLNYLMMVRRKGNEQVTFTCKGGR